MVGQRDVSREMAKAARFYADRYERWALEGGSDEHGISADECRHFAEVQRDRAAALQRHADGE